MTRFLSAVILLIFMISCSSPGQKELTAYSQPENEESSNLVEYGRIISSVTTKNDLSVTYAVYIPASYSITKKWPVLLLFDAQARGSLPLELYKVNAEQLGYILMCSNESRNGNPPQLTDKIISALLLEATTRYNADTNRIYTGGFSGGARIAALCAIQNPLVKGIIGISAGFPDNQLPSHQLRFIGVTAKEDFNYKELTQLDARLSKSHFQHSLFIYNGKHDWCPAGIINNSLILFAADAMRNKFIPINKNLLEENKKLNLREVKLLKDEQLYKEAALRLRFILDCNKDLVESGDITNQLVRIQSTSEWQKKEKESHKLALEEETQVSNFIQSIGRPMDWWEIEINKIRQAIIAAPGNERSYMLKRVLAGVSIQCYMYTQQLIKSDEAEKTYYMISLYKLVDPENKDPWFFSAVLEARNGNNDKALHDLSIAIDKGFDDRDRLLNEVAFQPLQSTTGFNSLLSKITSH